MTKQFDSLTGALTTDLYLEGEVMTSQDSDFTGCWSGADGGITCNTVPIGNTLTDDIDARYGLDGDVNPDYGEFDPGFNYEGYDSLAQSSASDLSVDALNSNSGADQPVSLQAVSVDKTFRVSRARPVGWHKEVMLKALFQEKRLFL